MRSGVIKKYAYLAREFWGSIIASYPQLDIECFVDNNKAKCGMDYLGIPVVHFEDWLKKYANNSIIIISTRLYYRPIFEQLINSEIQEENIINAGKMTDDLSKRQRSYALFQVLVAVLMSQKIMRQMR